MDIRNIAFNQFGTIDCEIDHPEWGWIPFTADPDDPEELGRLVYDAALEAGPAPYVPPAPEPVSADDVARERDRRLELDFEFGGVMYQRDRVSMSRIAGASQLAALAIAQGAQAGDLLWHGGDTPFGWIASDDTVTPMDAQTVIAFGMAAAARETQLVFAARNLRNMDPIPDDFADDKWWS